MGDEKKDEDSMAGSTKAVVEAVAILDGLARKWALDVRRWLDTRGKARAAEIDEGLSTLRFSAGGFAEILKLIADGKYSAQQQMDLQNYLSRGGGAIYDSLLMIRRERRFIDKRLGPQFYDRLERDVMVVKNEIRGKIAVLGASKSTKAQKSKMAEEILADIERFNADLAELRTILSPPQLKYVADRAKTELERYKIRTQHLDK
jgi:hypothetical protein